METKRELYNFINNLKAQHDFALTFMSIREFCEWELGIRTATMKFKTGGLRGMSLPKQDGQAPIILLSENRNEVEQDFDCIHELVHVLRHPSANATCFRCYDRVRPNQNAFYEWEANEGAAEFLMPHRDFIPSMVDKIAFIEDDNIRMLPEYVWNLADQFHVTSQMVQLRISNLRYETLQYLSGISLDDLDIRSNSSQKRAGIDYSQIQIKPWYGIPRVYNGPVLGCCSNFWY